VSGNNTRLKKKNVSMVDQVKAEVRQQQREKEKRIVKTFRRLLNHGKGKLMIVNDGRPGHYVSGA